VCAVILIPGQISVQYSAVQSKLDTPDAFCPMNYRQCPVYRNGCNISVKIDKIHERDSR
jgi:hypothetical protein